MDEIPVEVLKRELCPRISAADLISLHGLTTRNDHSPPGSPEKLLPVDIRSPDEYPFLIHMESLFHTSGQVAIYAFIWLCVHCLLCLHISMNRIYSLRNVTWRYIRVAGKV